MTRAGRREWIGLAVTALPCVLYSMDLTVLNLAVPSLSAELKPSSTELLWIVDIYGFLVAGSLITMGTLGDPAASALSETSSEFGGALGIAVLDSIVTAIYRGEVAGALPAGVPAEAAEIARHTIGGAVSVAGELSGALGAELLASAREAFAQAFGTTAAISAAIAVGVAMLAAALLRRGRAMQGTTEKMSG